MNEQEIRRRIRNAFIIGMARSSEGFNGECPIGALAPKNPYNKDSPEEVDLFDFFANPEVNRLADQYMATGGAIPAQRLAMRRRFGRPHQRGCWAINH